MSVELYKLATIKLKNELKRREEEGEYFIEGIDRVKKLIEQRISELVNVCDYTQDAVYCEVTYLFDGVWKVRVRLPLSNEKEFEFSVDRDPSATDRFACLDIVIREFFMEVRNETVRKALSRIGNTGLHLDLD